jgi:hypothetical protein
MREEHFLVTLGVQDDDNPPDFKKKLTVISSSKSIIICEPPTLARYVKIEREGEALQLNEVDVYATGKLFRLVLQNHGQKSGFVTNPKCFRI